MINKHQQNLKSLIELQLVNIKKIFIKGYLLNRTNEIFTIYNINPKIPNTCTLKDDEGNVLKGGFCKENMEINFLLKKYLKRKSDKLFISG